MKIQMNIFTGIHSFFTLGLDEQGSDFLISKLRRKFCDHWIPLNTLLIDVLALEGNFFDDTTMVVVNK